MRGVPNNFATGSKNSSLSLRQACSIKAAPALSHSGPSGMRSACRRPRLRQVGEILEEAMRFAKSPMQALTLAVREYFVLARRYPLRHRLLFEVSEHGGLESEARRAFDTVTGLIAAAQHAGEVQDGDPAQLSALICSTIHGLANFELIGQGKDSVIVRDADSLTPILLNLIVKKPAQPRETSAA